MKHVFMIAALVLATGCRFLHYTMRMATCSWRPRWT